MTIRGTKNLRFFADIAAKKWPLGQLEFGDVVLVASLRYGWAEHAVSGSVERQLRLR